ncbi:MAG: redoxin domain-containing protein [SAR202 cluster bacterium]|nr:redoxin domain-containing protein [SAR202 cluster bacterium]
MPLQVGDPAPDVTFNGPDRTTYALSSFKGKKNVVLAFYPRAFTGG